MLDTVKMTKLTSDLPSKSEKMRTLSKAGYSRGDIARFLGTSYQFVRNVLIRESERSSDGGAGRPKKKPAASAGADSSRLLVGAGGEVKLPEKIMAALGLKAGDALIASLEDSEIRLMTVPTAVRKVQAILRQYVPEGVSLVDELLEDRRREAERERAE